MKSIDFVYPLEKNFEKIFSLESYGEEPDQLRIIVPTIIFPEEPFDIKIVVVDINGNPSFECDEILSFEENIFEERIPDIKFQKGKPSIIWIKNVKCKKEGIFRIPLKFNGKTFFSNPFICSENYKYKIYWGDPHVHTVLSDCHPDTCRSSFFAYISGKYLTFLDWISITDHVSNGRGTLGKWREGLYMSEFFNEPLKFVTIPGYEASFKSGSGGDFNIYFSKFPDYFVEDYENGNIKSVCEKLIQKANQQNFEFFVVPHHTSRAQKHGELSENIYPGRELMPLIEIYSKWGSSEYHENPESLLNPHNGPSYVFDFLKKGYILGFIAGSDTHSTIQLGKENSKHLIYPCGFTAVFTDILERGNIFQAMKKRKTYATSKERIFIDFQINNIPQGEILYLKENIPREIKFTAASQTDIKSIEIIRNCKVILKMDNKEWICKGKFVDDEDINNIYLETEKTGKFIFYYLRLRTYSNACGWSSPVFILLKY